MAKKIRDVGPVQRRVNPKVITKALGAEKVGIEVGIKQGPISLFSLRQFLVSRCGQLAGDQRW